MFLSRYRPHAPTPHRCTPRGPLDAGVAVRRRPLRGGHGRPGSCGTAGASRPERCALPRSGRLRHTRRGRASTAGRRELAAAGVLLHEAVGVGTRYSTFDRELPAAFSAVRNFHCSLTTSHWSHPCSAPRRTGRAANSDSCPSSPSLHRT
jgi:hypothetical protein